MARQFRNSIDLEATFAPTSMMMLPKMLMHYLLNVRSEFVVVTLDIKDAFLMAAQPATEKAYVQIEDRIYKLLRCLPGQRTAASQWFGLFASACRDFGMQQDLMQPTLMLMNNLLYLTVHVDDVFIVGRDDKVRELIQYFKEEKQWNVEEKGPFGQGDRFFYLKRQFNLGMRHRDIRCDRKQYDSFEKDVDIYSRFYRKTLLDANFTKKDDSAILEGAEITKCRSIVGRLMYMGGERPDAQYAIQCLARHMAKPTKNALKNAWHTCSYLFGTGGYGVRLEERRKGQSMMDFREVEEVEDAEQHLVEVVTDSDHAGNKNDHKSTTHAGIHRWQPHRQQSQKPESHRPLVREGEFMALVAGCSEGMLVRHLWNKITGGECQMKARSDSSAARDDPKARHRQSQALRCLNVVDAAERARKSPDSGAIPTDLNSADIGTKNLPKKRLRGLQFMLHMVDAVGDRVGEQEFREIEEQHQMKQGMKKFGKSKDLRIGVMLCTLACIGALSLIRWIRDYIHEFLDDTKAFIQEITKAMKWVKKVDLNVQVERVDQETQVSVPNARLERELEQTANELFRKETYIEELEQDMEKMKERLAEFLQDREIAEKRNSRLEEQMHRLRMTPSGRVLHFAAGCPHFMTRQPIKMCHTCLNERGVLESRTCT